MSDKPWIEAIAEDDLDTTAAGPVLAIRALSAQSTVRGGGSRCV